MGLLGTIIGAGINAGMGALNNQWAAERAREDRAENYKYGEMAATNADTRTRALYNDFYSPSALARQYKEAGLSPSIMFGGTPGQGGASGASAAGAASVSTPFMPMSLLEGAQIANLNAQTDKVKAETKNIDKDTELKEIERIMSEMTKNIKTVEFDISTMMVKMDDGSTESMYEVAKRHNDYDTFLQELRDTGNEQFIRYAGSEIGQKESWNRLLKKLEAKNTTAKDMLVIMGMILSNYMHSAGIQVNTGDSYFMKKD